MEVSSGGLRNHDLVGQVHDNFDELLEAEYQPAEMRPLGYRPWAGFTLPWFYLPEVKQLPILKAKKVSGKDRKKLTLLKHIGKSLQRGLLSQERTGENLFPHMGRYMPGPAPGSTMARCT